MRMRTLAGCFLRYVVGTATVNNIQIKLFLWIFTTRRTRCVRHVALRVTRGTRSSGIWRRDAGQSATRRHTRRTKLSATSPWRPRHSFHSDRRLGSSISRKEISAYTLNRSRPDRFHKHVRRLVICITSTYSHYWLSWLHVVWLSLCSYWSI